MIETGGVMLHELPTLPITVNDDIDEGNLSFVEDEAPEEDEEQEAESEVKLLSAN